MKQQVDPRKARSRKFLTDALIALMEQKDIESISVSDLVEKAEVTRSTFYLQFEDKPDFLRQIVDELFAGLRKQALPDATVKGQGLGEQAQRSFYLNHFKYVAEHAGFFRVMLSDRGMPDFRRKMEESARITYEKVLANVTDAELPMPRQYLVQYVISAHIGLTGMWLEDGMKYSPSYMAELLTQLTLKGVFLGLGMHDKILLPQ